MGVGSRAVCVADAEARLGSENNRLVEIVEALTMSSKVGCLLSRVRKQTLLRANRANGPEGVMDSKRISRSEALDTNRSHLEL